MDDISRGIATAAMTLHSVLLQALIEQGLLTPVAALGIVGKTLGAVDASPQSEDEEAVAAVPEQCSWGRHRLAQPPSGANSH
jgi:hypothetical protein